MSVSVYCIENNITNKKYVGITKTSLNRRWNSHKSASKSRQTTLYNSIRKHGIGVFSINTLVICPDWDYACGLERKLIATGDYQYNMADGGEGGFNVKDVDAWKEKLSKARRASGHKPFSGKKHSEETKRKCAEAARKRWSS